ncbi:uncharacterized protein LOC141598746 [Silene latifolia]|uniref:uncharacterized protein LOC141598746 n=1 Tax=Silene latifolia TaxID=37657 RepID=UPI003D772D1F
MSHMKGDLLTRTTKLVKGFAKREPLWLKPMQMSPPPVFPRANGKVNVITLPEDAYVKKFYEKHPESQYEDPIKLSGFNPVPARIFASRVLELKEKGVGEKEAIAAADMEYRAEKKAKKQAYSRLKKISRDLGEKPKSNPYPSAVKEIQAEERLYVRERFFDPQILDMVRKVKEEKAAEMHERFGGDRSGGQQRFGVQDRFRGQQRFGGQDRLGGQQRFGGQDRFGGQLSSGGLDRLLGQQSSGGMDGFVGQQSSGGLNRLLGQQSSGGLDRLLGQQSSGGQDRFVGQRSSGGLLGGISRQGR